MRLLLDEMISPAVARRLVENGYDAQAIKRDRPELESLPDAEIVRRMTEERRAVVTNDVADFQPIHEQTLARGEAHFGLVFSNDATLPRNKAGVGLWVQTLAALLDEHQTEDALRNRTHHLR
ncbi:MAG: DUF5615 family PIN-like protein [Actinomycetota bacterium]|nr:DUF5615 family PIN-like protein [Actinomycetota bacterium]